MLEIFNLFLPTGNMIKVGPLTLKKKCFYLLQLKAVKNDEKYSLFHLNPLTTNGSVI